MAPASAAAPPPEVPEAPLAWGTRPSKKGPLFPIVDGMCIHGEIWPMAGGGALFTYGNGTGPWTRGGRPTVARLADEGIDTVSLGVGAGANVEAWGDIGPMGMVGSWPSPLLLFSMDQGGSRMRDWPSIWSHGDKGWSLLASHRENDAPGYMKPVLFGGHAVAARREYANYSDWKSTSFKSWPMDPSARPIAGLGGLARPGFEVDQVVANDTTLFALGLLEGSGNAPAVHVLRWLENGKVSETPLPEGGARVVGTRPSLVLAVGGTKLFRFAAGKLAPIALRLPSNDQLASGGIAPDGDVWLLTTKKVVLVVHHGTDAVDESPLPAPSVSRPKEAVQHWPTSGDLLGGVEVGDPYAIGEGGSLFHYETGKWSEVELPEAPFASSGKYQAQAVVVPAKGELYVNAGYAEKGSGWKTAERYRAVLGNKRPREVLRCNEPMATYGSGTGFMSFPPIASDSCTTPFVVLLRTGYHVDAKDALYIYDRKTDYPSVRAAIKATPSLGKEIDLVDFVSGAQRYVGARVPTVAAGRELALAVVKNVQASPTEVRPEIVCGTPTAERTLRVDVATGRIVTPLRGE